MTKIDRKNGAVIMSGEYRNYNIKAVAVCKPEDKFDEETGRKIARLKWKLYQARIDRKIIAQEIDNQRRELGEMLEKLARVEIKQDKATDKLHNFLGTLN